jgi:hypothetical protein
MAISYSSRIATRGLSFVVDAANPASLPTNVNRNLVLQPENLSNVAWSKTAIDVALSTSTTAPNGTSTVYSVTEQANSAQHLLSYSLGTVVINDTFTWSGHFKNNTNTTQIVLHTNGEGTATFNISGALAGTVSANVGAGTLSSSIESVGNGWYRCAAVFRKANTTGTFYVSNQNGLGSYVGATSISYFAWGLQLEYNTAVTPYYSATQSAATLNTRWNDLTGTSRPITTGLNSVEVLVVAGGGAGGSGNGLGYESGGGGAGGLIYNAAYPISSGTYTVTVGAGGTSVAAGGIPTINLCTNGENSIFGPLIAIGGGAGGSGGFNGNQGGSGGGAAYSGVTSRLLGGGNVPSQGNNGGAHQATSLGDVTNRGGGGGGAAQSGLAAAAGGAGGAGLSYNISGTSTFYAGGGGGNGSSAGGLGGGGAGAAVATSGTPNTGGGGGAGSWDGASAAPIGKGGAGGSGIVIVRYLEPQRASGGTITIANGYVTHTFTAGTSSFVVAPTPTENRSYGTFQNNVTYDSRNSGALVFDNNTSYVAFPDLSSQTNSPLSVFAWVYLNATPVGTNGIWGHFGVNNNNIHYEINPTATRLRLGDTNKADLPMLAVGSWQFVGFTSTGSSHSYYVNGVLSTTWAGATGTILGSSGAVPSSHMVGRSDATRVWNGRIAHVAVYTAELTATEVLNNYTALRGRYGV